ncbi:MAG: PAS domain S-box protein [Polaromonas sp.]|nr:PAS domain S-box protein [Polaromonas sp.]
MAVFSAKGITLRRLSGLGVGQPQLKAWGPLDLTGEGLVLLNAKGQITEINAQALRFLNCILPDLTGRDFWDAVPPEIVNEHQSSTGRALASSAQHVFVVHNKFEGAWLEYAFRTYPSGYIVTLRDVTVAQKLQVMLDDSERRNRLIFEVNPNAMWIFDLVSLRILAVNRAAVDFYGISQSIFLNLAVGALFPDGEGAALLACVSGAAGQLLEPQLCKQKKNDGQLVLVELAFGRLVWDEHQAVLVSLADVTERHLADRGLRRENAELELELSKQRLELQNTKRDLEAFTYALSNDLQAPLHAANGFAAMLTDKYAAVLDAPGRHYVSRIQASTHQLAKLVDDLRTLVQLPTVSLSGGVEKVDVTALCAALIDDLRAKDPGRVVTVEMETSLSLNADKRLVTTALACLLENAWKFTSKKLDGWIKVSLTASLSARKTPGELVLQVSDNGTGFDDAYSDKLFRAFQRLHSAADFAGNGLGLAIVKRVAERHGGRVWAETSPTGASFFMAFPQAQT